MENSWICKACLATNVKMYNMQTLSLITIYLDVTGISDIGVHTYICFECLARLQKCHNFRLNCYKAHESLANVVTKEDVQRERKLKNLESQLSVNLLTISVLTASECDDKEQTNNPGTFVFNIKKEKVDATENMKYEFISKNTVQDVDENSKTSTEFNDDNSFSCDNNPTIEENSKEISIVIKKSKVDTIIGKKINHDPLKKSKKKRSLKNKSTQNKILFDAKYFEEFATVTSMTSEDAKREVELRKESSNFKNSSQKCNLCYRGFENENTYNNHMKIHTSGDYECEFCYRRFPKRYLCTRHVSTCHKLKITCKKCPYVCFSTAQATSHIKLHKGIKYTCELCHKSFSMHNTLASHKRIKHATQFVCALCGSTFAVEKGLKAHQKLIHKQDTNEKKGPMCNECDIQFATETAWKRHLVLSSNHQVSGCQVCGETFADKTQVKSHTCCKRSPVKHACAICAKVLSNRSEYNTHMTSQHPECAVARRIRAADTLPFVCEFCGKRFRHPSVMLSHQKKHTGERPYSCNICGKAFSYQAAVSAHRETHRAIRVQRDKYACDMCDKLFSTKSSLTKHVKNHLNIRPHSCDICGKSYQHQCDVKYHKQHVHGNVPWPTRDRRKPTNDEQHLK